MIGHQDSVDLLGKGQLYALIAILIVIIFIIFYKWDSVNACIRLFEAPLVSIGCENCRLKIKWKIVKLKDAEYLNEEKHFDEELLDLYAKKGRMKQPLEIPFYDDEDNEIIYTNFRQLYNRIKI